MRFARGVFGRGREEMGTGCGEDVEAGVLAWSAGREVKPYSVVVGRE